jgi:hypothetical protein
VTCAPLAVPGATAITLRAAIESVLAEAAFHDSARRLAAEIASLPTARASGGCADGCRAGLAMIACRQPVARAAACAPVARVNCGQTSQNAGWRRCCCDRPRMRAMPSWKHERIRRAAHGAALLWLAACSGRVVEHTHDSSARSDSGHPLQRELARRGLV